MHPLNFRLEVALRADISTKPESILHSDALIHLLIPAQYKSFTYLRTSLFILVSDIAIFVLKGDVKLELTN